MKRIIAISICLVFVLSASTILLAPEKMEKRMTFEQFKKEVMASIERRNGELITLFEAGNFGEMPKIFTRYSKVVTHIGEVIEAKDSAEYWSKVSEKMKGRSLKFEKPHFYGWELMLNDPPCPEETDFVVFEITKFSFVGASNGAIRSAQRHRVKCTRD